MIFKSMTNNRRLIKEIAKADRYPVCYMWDELLDEVLNTADIVRVDEYSLYFCCGTKLWIADRWFAYGQPYMKDYEKNVVPTPKTTAKLYNIHMDYLKKTFRENRIKNLEESINKFNGE